MKDNTISLSKFLSRTLGLTGKDLTKIKHSDVQHLFPEVTTETLTNIKKNKELLKKVVFVDDGSKVIPYYCDYNIDLYEELEVIIVQDDKNDNKNNDEIIDLEQLTVYELTLLLRRKFNTSLQNRKAKQELKRRGAYKIKKRKYKEKKRGILYEKY